MAELRRLLLAVAAVAVLAVACGQEAEAPAAGEDLPPVTANVSVDRAVATTGDVITYRVEVEYAEGYEVELPEPGARIAGFRIIDLGSEPQRKVGDRVREERWYRLRADLVGSYILPPITVGYSSPQGEREELQTSEIFVEVESVLPQEGEVTDIRDVKPLRRPPARIPWPWIVAAAILIVLALSAWWLLRRRARGPREELIVPAHELAFRELDRLRRTDFSNLEELRTYYFAISEVLRKYIEGRFGLNATDLTSEEILGREDWLQQLGDANAERLQVFLRSTDRVKYAAEVPGEREIEETYEAALGFVESTRPIPAGVGEDVNGTQPDQGPPTAGELDPLPPAAHPGETTEEPRRVAEA